MDKFENILVASLLLGLIGTLSYFHYSSINTANSIDSLRKEITAIKDIQLIEKGINLTGIDGYYNGVYFVVETENKDTDRVEQITLHEYGHFIYHQMLNKTEKTLWKSSEEFAERYENEHTICSGGK